MPKIFLRGVKDPVVVSESVARELRDRQKRGETEGTVTVGGATFDVAMVKAIMPDAGEAFTDHQREARMTLFHQQYEEWRMAVRAALRISARDRAVRDLRGPFETFWRAVFAPAKNRDVSAVPPSVRKAFGERAVAYFTENPQHVHIPFDVWRDLVENAVGRTHYTIVGEQVVRSIFRTIFQANQEAERVYRNAPTAVRSPLPTEPDPAAEMPIEDVRTLFPEPEGAV